MSCKCSGVVLSGFTVQYRDGMLLGLDGSDTVLCSDIERFTDEVELSVELDCGELLLWVGDDDKGCRDHAEDRVKLNYCPFCGVRLD